MVLRRVSLAIALSAGLAFAQQPIVGRVLDEAGQPLSGVAVSLFDDTHTWTTKELAAHPVTRSDADGRFEIPANAPGPGWNNALFTARGRMSMAVKRREFGLLPIVLPRGHVLAGRVRDEDGNGIAGVRVTCRDYLRDQIFLGQNWYRRPDPEPRTAATTDARGVFVLPGACATAAVLRAEADGWQIGWLGPVSVADPAELTLLPRPIIDVRVVDANDKPLSNVIARVRSGRESRSVLVDNEGRTKVTWRDQPISISVSQRDDDVRRSGVVEIKEPIERATVRVVERKARSLPRSDVEVAEGHSIRVRATGPDGQPVLGFRAAAWFIQSRSQRHRSDARQLRQFDACAQATETGVLDLPVHYGTRNHNQNDTVLVLVTAEGLGTGRATPVAGTEETTVELEPAGTIAGTLIDALTGKPIAGARVWSLTDWEASDSVVYDGTAKFEVGSFAVTTDAAGEFQLDNLKPGVHRVFCSADGYAPFRPHAAQVAEDQAAKAGRLELAPLLDRRIEVRGAVPTGAAFRVHRHRPGHWSSGDATDYTSLFRLDDKDAFTVPKLAPGTYDIQLVVPRRPRQGLPHKVLLERVEIAPSTDKLSVDTSHAQLAILRGTIKGNVPPQRLAVVSAPEDGGNMSYGYLYYEGTHSPVDLRGTFELQVPPGSQELVVFDVMTGAMLHRAPPAELGAGNEHEVEIVVEAAEVAFSIDGTDYDPTAWYWVELVPPFEYWPAGVGRISTSDNEQYRRQMGAALFPGQQQGVLYVPRVESVLRIAPMVNGRRQPPRNGFVFSVDFNPTHEAGRSVPLRVGS